MIDDKVISYFTVMKNSIRQLWRCHSRQWCDIDRTTSEIYWHHDVMSVRSCSSKLNGERPPEDRWLLSCDINSNIFNPGQAGEG